jgi:site-specific DNA-cytosine methylase
MKILIACEESQAVCKEFRKLGHEAYSCDILDCSGGHPEWHIKNDVIEVINGGGYEMMIAFPPCTHLTVSGARHFEQKRKDGRQQQGIDFFMSMINAPIEKIAVENPVGIMSTIYRKPDQIIQPYYFGDPFQKTTCLWLKNLNPLYYNLEPNIFDTNVTSTKDKGEMIYLIDKKTGKQKSQAKWYYDALINAKTKEERSTLRSKTFPGIAKAMAEQWG